jgi:hypothetical protein
METIDPKQFNLHARTILRKVDSSSIAVVIHRKTRIVMKDGRGILEKAKKIQEKLPGAKVILETTAPVCSKTKIYLKENGVEVE